MPEIIYVEDCAADRHLLLAAHHEAGVSTSLRLLSSGVALFAYLDSLPADDHEQRIVLLDLNMPGQSGLDVLEILQARYTHLPMLVWMFSNSTRMAEHGQLKRAGAARFVTKPVDHDLTIALIRELSRRLGEAPKRSTQRREGLRRVLLIEDSSSDAVLIREGIRADMPELELLHVSSLTAALVALEEQNFDGLILDLHLPDAEKMGGLLDIIARWPHLPVVAVTGQYDRALGRAAIRAGAQDFIHKQGLANDSLLQALEFAVERQWLVNRLRTELHRSREDALSDPQTGLPNRRALEQHYQLLFEGKQEDRAQTNALVVIDIDGLKAANDQFGHKVGDDLIMLIVGALHRNLRLGDMLARVGGDEFVALLTALPAGDWVEVLIERMRQAIATLPSLAGGEVIPRASFGFAAIPLEGAPFQQIFDLADARMYEDKLSRRASGATASPPGRP